MATWSAARLRGHGVTMNTLDCEYIRALVRERSSIVIDDDKHYLIEARLSNLTLREGMDSLAALMQRLRAGNGELERKVVEAMTTNETMWFRDTHPFEALRRAILPDLIERRKGQQRLNLWCAASSTGQEPYSVLMVLREHFPVLRTWDVRFLATDLSSEMVARCREGRYNEIEMSRGMPAPLLDRYFERQGATWQLRGELRQAIEFRQLNLCRPWPFLPEMDIVFMRNVLIYFDVETKKAILARARRQLRKDGYLLVGSAETTLNLDDGFEPVTFDRSVAYQLKR